MRSNDAPATSCDPRGWKEDAKVTLLIAMGALLIAIVGGVLLNPDEERDEEREHAWPFF